jgi:uncharacterized protein YcaQ
LYEPTARGHEQIEPGERLRKLVLLITNILAPLPDRSLHMALQHLAHAAQVFKARRAEVTKLTDSGELATAVVDGVRYVWPAGRVVRKEPADMVRFLAPFDPMVWDRRRFEYFWGWSYRFEAYTRVIAELPLRRLPLLWREDVIGWVNVSNRQRALNIKAGFLRGEPTEAAFRRELEAEIERFRHFLQSGVQIS